MFPAPTIIRTSDGVRAYRAVHAAIQQAAERYSANVETAFTFVVGEIRGSQQTIRTTRWPAWSRASLASPPFKAKRSAASRPAKRAASVRL